MTMPTIKQRPRRVHMPTRSIPLVEDPAPRPEKVVFHLDAVNVHYGAFHAVRDVSFDIREHEITALIGPSGCGKSTLLRSLNRMNDLIPGARVEGTVAYHGEDIYHPDIDPVEVRRRI